MSDQQPKRRGRPPVDPAKLRKVRSIRLTDAHWHELMQVGTLWLEERLERSLRDRAKRQASLPS